MMSRFRTAAGWAAVLLTALLPLKFGAVAILPEMPGYFPPEGWMYLLTDWSPFFFAMLSGGLLLLILATERSFRWNPLLAGGMVLFAASLPGWFSTTGIRDYMYSTSLHLAAAGAWWCSAALLVRRAPEWRNRLLGAVALGTLLVGVIALRQNFFGFDEMRAFANEQAAKGIQIDPAVMAQIYDTRVRATFANNNMLANYLLLTAPVTIWMMVRLGGRFEPENLSKKIFLAAALLLTLLPLYFTRSRGALAALGAAALAAAWFLPLKRSSKATLAVVTVVLLAAGGFVFQRGRGTLTIQSRLDYGRTSAQLMREKPLAGFGWGGFYLEHTRRKQLISEETARDPHNVAASFASQSGIPAALAVLAVLLMPFYFFWKRRREKEAIAAVAAFGLLASFLQFFVDVGWEVSALLALYGTLSASLLLQEEKKKKVETPLPLPGRCALGAGLGLLAALSLAGGFVMLRSEAALAEFHEWVQPETEESLRQPHTAWEVEESVQKFNRLRPWSAAADETAGHFFLAAGEVDLAEKHFRRAAALVPPHHSLEHGFFDLAVRRGDAEAAHRHREKMRQLFPTSRKLPPEPAVRPGDRRPVSAPPATPSK